jgi:hypothetical protein
MSFTFGLWMGACLGAVLTFVLFAAKVWRRGEEHGRREASRDLATAASMLGKRVDDLELLRIAREPVPESFLIKAQQEVLEWAETLVRQLQKEQQIPPPSLPPLEALSDSEKIQPL